MRGGVVLGELVVGGYDDGLKEDLFLLVVCIWVFGVNYWEVGVEVFKVFFKVVVYVFFWKDLRFECFWFGRVLSVVSCWWDIVICWCKWWWYNSIFVRGWVEFGLVEDGVVIGVIGIDIGGW